MFYRLPPQGVQVAPSGWIRPLAHHSEPQCEAQCFAPPLLFRIPTIDILQPCTSGQPESQEANIFKPWIVLFWLLLQSQHPTEKSLPLPRDPLPGLLTPPDVHWLNHDVPVYVATHALLDAFFPFGPDPPVLCSTGLLRLLGKPALPWLE